MPYKILEHTADIRIRLSAKTLEELFQTALEVMAEILFPGILKTKTNIRNKEIITIEAPDSTTLLIDFLNDVLSHSYINKAVYFKVKFTKLSQTSLTAEVKGIFVEEFKEDIKAATFHEAEIKKTKGLYETNLIFDI